MRIGYLVPEFPGQTHAFFWRELAALRERGHGVQLFSTRRPKESSRHEFDDVARSQTRYLMPPVPWRVARGIARAQLSGLRALIRYIRACEQKTPRDTIRLCGIAICAAALADWCRELDLQHVHVHSCADAAHLGAMSHLMGGPSYSLTLHGDLPVYGRDHRSKMAGASFVSAVTLPLQQQIVDNVGLPAGRVPVVWMGVDTDRFAPFASPPRHGVGDERLRIVTIARLNVTKGHEYALQAVRRLLDEGFDIRYTIAGSGPEKAAIEGQVAALGLHDVVELAGSVSERAVLDLLHHSDIFLLPSFGLGEAAPVSVMEAMACGVPVICSAIGGTPDMITDGEDGILVSQRDVDSLVSAIRHLAGGPTERVRLSRAARERALEAFDYRINADALIYEMCCPREEGDRCLDKA